MIAFLAALLVSHSTAASDVPQEESKSSSSSSTVLRRRAVVDYRTASPNSTPPPFTAAKNPTKNPAGLLFCAGKCPSGQNCEEYTGDSCDPKKGDVNCIGVCVPSAPNTQPVKAPTKNPTIKPPTKKPTVKPPTKSPTRATASSPTIVPARATLCAPYANIFCLYGKKCVDNPNDVCDPLKTAKCPGICV